MSFVEPNRADLDADLANARASYTRELRGAPAPARRRAAPKPRSRPASVAKQERILSWLAMAPQGVTVAEVAALVGISRQLCLYHVKRLAAAGRLAAVLEPCARNGQCQYRLWDEHRLATAILAHGPGAWRVAA